MLYQPIAPHVPAAATPANAACVVERLHPADHWLVEHELRITQRVWKDGMEPFFYVAHTVAPQYAFAANASRSLWQTVYSTLPPTDYQTLHDALLDCTTAQAWLGVLLPALEHLLEGLVWLQQQGYAYALFHPDAVLVPRCNPTVPFLTNVHFALPLHPSSPVSPLLLEQEWPEETYCVAPELLHEKRPHWPPDKALASLYCLSPEARAKYLLSWQQQVQQPSQPTDNAAKTWDSYGLASLFFWYFRSNDVRLSLTAHAWIKPLAKLMLQQVSPSPDRRLSISSLRLQFAALLRELDSLLL